MVKRYSVALSLDEISEAQMAETFTHHAALRVAIDRPYYLFTWPSYESGGVVSDCVGSFETLAIAMSQDGLGENGCIVEMRGDGLWIVAEYSGYPPAWYFEVRRLGNELAN